MVSKERKRTFDSGYEEHTNIKFQFYYPKIRRHVVLWTRQDTRASLQTNATSSVHRNSCEVSTCQEDTFGHLWPDSDKNIHNITPPRG